MDEAVADLIEKREHGRLRAHATFLAINGLRITADADTPFAFIIGLYETASFRFEHLGPWLRWNTAPLRDAE